MAAVACGGRHVDDRHDLGGGDRLGRQVGPERARPPPAGGVADQTARPGLESMPETVVTRPCSAGSPRRRSPSTRIDCSTKWLNGPPAKAMPPVRVGVPAGSRPSSRCWTRTAAGKHEYTSARRISRSGRPRWRAAARPSTPMAGQASRWRRAVRVTASEECSATWGKSQRSAATPASRARSAEQISRAEDWSTVHWLACHRL